MMRFHNEQKEFSISGIKFGGQPGTRRTVMVGSLCYPRHSIVEDRISGVCKPGSLKRLIETMNAAAVETGTPGAVMLYAETAQAMEAYLREVSELTTFPLFLDSPSSEVRLAGCRAAHDMGLGDRIVYNSLSAGATSEELEGIKDSGIRASVLLAFNPKDIQTKGKIYLLEDGGGILPDGLIELAKQSGISMPLLDTAVMAADQNAGASLRTIMVAKAKWGLPCGCALHNAVESYGPLSKLEGEDRKIYRYVDVASVVMPMMAGADFVMYGPIEYSRRAFHAAGFADEMLKQSVSDL